MAEFNQNTEKTSEEEIKVSQDTDQETAAFQDSFYGVELVHDAHRLALMNAYLHNVPAHIFCEDSLSPSAKRLKGFDVILTNPPFGLPAVSLSANSLNGIVTSIASVLPAKSGCSSRYTSYTFPFAVTCITVL